MLLTSESEMVGGKGRRLGRVTLNHVHGEAVTQYIEVNRLTEGQIIYFPFC